MDRSSRFRNFVIEFFNDLFRKTGESGGIESKKYRYYVSHRKFELSITLAQEEDRIEVIYSLKQEFDSQSLLSSFFSTLKKTDFHCQYMIRDHKAPDKKEEGVYGERAKRAKELAENYNEKIMYIDKNKVYTYRAKTNSITEPSITIQCGTRNYTFSSEKEIDEWNKKIQLDISAVLEKEKEFIDWVQTFDSDIKIASNQNAHRILFGKNTLVFRIQVSSLGYRLKLDDFIISELNLEEIMKKAKRQWTKHYEKEKVRALL